MAYQQVKYNNDITAGQTITGQTFTPVISLHSYSVTVSTTSSTRVISKVLITLVEHMTYIMLVILQYLNQ